MASDGVLGKTCIMPSSRCTKQGGWLGVQNEFTTTPQRSDAIICAANLYVRNDPSPLLCLASFLSCGAQPPRSLGFTPTVHRAFAQPFVMTLTQARGCVGAGAGELAHCHGVKLAAAKL